MKIITKCVISMETLQVIEEESYYYSGPIAECKGGGGGSTSGKVGFPAYMETLHSKWLDSTGTDILTMSMVDAMEAAHGNSPWTALTAYNPDTDITFWEAAMDSLRTLLTGLSDTADWASLYTQADASIDAVVEADIVQSVSDFSDQLDDEIESKVLPRFRRGMQDINAVVSSAFPIGAALIESFRNREVAKHGSSVRLNLMDRKSGFILAGTEQMIKLSLTRLGLEEGYVRNVVESRRIKVVAKNEQTKFDATIDEADALWDIEVFQQGGNLLSAIGGGVVKPTKTGPSMVQSVLGGAMSGATAGATVGGPWGAAIGGVIGAASAFL